MGDADLRRTGDRRSTTGGEAPEPLLRGGPKRDSCMAPQLPFELGPRMGTGWKTAVESEEASGAGDLIDDARESWEVCDDADVLGTVGEHFDDAGPATDVGGAPIGVVLDGLDAWYELLSEGVQPASVIMAWNLDDDRDSPVDARSWPSGASAAEFSRRAVEHPADDRIHLAKAAEPGHVCDRRDAQIGIVQQMSCEVGPSVDRELCRRQSDGGLEQPA